MNVVLMYSNFLFRTKTDLELRQRTKRCLYVLVVVLHNCCGRTCFPAYCHLVAGLFTCDTETHYFDKQFNKIVSVALLVTRIVSLLLTKS